MLLKLCSQLRLGVKFGSVHVKKPHNFGATPKIYIPNHYKSIYSHHYKNPLSKRKFYHLLFYSYVPKGYRLENHSFLRSLLLHTCIPYAGFSTVKSLLCSVSKSYIHWNILQHVHKLFNHFLSVHD